MLEGGVIENGCRWKAVLCQEDGQLSRIQYAGWFLMKLLEGAQLGTTFCLLAMWAPTLSLTSIITYYLGRPLAPHNL